MSFTPTTTRRRLYAGLGLVMLVLLVAVAIGAYRKAFTSVVAVDVRADRSGLLLDPGADVRVRGVPVGEVRTVEVEGRGARLRLALDTDAVASIPASTVAYIEPSTVFGAKHVTLTPSNGPVLNPIRAGDVIPTKRVTVEINNMFAELQDVLTTVRPSKLNVTLSAIASALQGRGERLGRDIEQFDNYLSRLNTSLPALREDIERFADVLDTYAAAAPDLVKITRNVTITSATLSETQTMLHATLLDLTRAAGNGQEFLGRLGGPLVTAVDALDPVTRLLSRYSPALTCTIQGLNEVRGRVEALGKSVPGVRVDASFLPGQQGYQYPRDLPKVVTGDGPDCFGLPFVSRDEVPTPRIRFRDGTHVYDGTSDAATIGIPPANVYEDMLFEQFFGVTPQEVQPR